MVGRRIPVPESGDANDVIYDLEPGDYCGPLEPLLPWATLLDMLLLRQCKAVKERRGRSGYYGRCELKAGHEGAHALERGFDTPRWSSDWVSQ